MAPMTFNLKLRCTVCGGHYLHRRRSIPIHLVATRADQCGDADDLRVLQRQFGRGHIRRHQDFGGRKLLAHAIREIHDGFHALAAIDELFAANVLRGATNHKHNSIFQVLKMFK